MNRSFLQQILDLGVRQAYRVAHRCLTVFNTLVPLAGRGAYVAVWYNEHILLIQNGHKSYRTFPPVGMWGHQGIECAAVRGLREEVEFKQLEMS